ncbi:PD-(D/E)XK nuclease family protein [Propylenella binzhouense]|nr:PD-(D/E)XK nuclease family protein [Propylenella binzhouense]
MHRRIVLTPLDRTGPTLWSHMRLCALRGAFAASRAAESFVLHDPRAWLGTAFHKVAEAAAQPGATAATTEQVWKAAVDEAAAAARSHPLDARYAAPDRWPGYFLVRQRALSSAQGIVAANTGSQRKAPRSGSVSAERLLLARGGRLAGRPDRFDGRVLTEYKSSIPDPAWRGAGAVLEGFRRQLRLYAAIIAEALGRWPAQGRIVAASGQTMDVPLDPAVCGAEARDALAALDSLNRALAAAAPPEALARPGEEACTACPFQALCPAFWPWLATAGSNGLTETAAAGVLDRIELGQDGDLYTAYLSIHQPFMPPEIQPLVLRRSIHGDLTASPKDARWRIVSAKLKPDGRLRADPSTCVFAVDDLPGVVTGATPASANQLS